MEKRNDPRRTREREDAGVGRMGGARMTTLDDLKPCPFCGARPVAPFTYGDWHVVGCGNAMLCGATIMGGTVEEAIENWNRRTHEPKEPTP